MPAKKITFEQALSELETILKQMESSDVSLEDSIKLYEKAFKMLEFCYTSLELGKGQIMDINEKINKIKNSKEDLFND